MMLSGQFFRTVTISKEVTEAGYLYAQQFQLSAKVWMLEFPWTVSFRLREVEGQDIRHPNTWSDKTKGLIFPVRALTDGVDIGCRG
jgi:hypothetical protein